MRKADRRLQARTILSFLLSIALVLNGVPAQALDDEDAGDSIAEATDYSSEESAVFVDGGGVEHTLDPAGSTTVASGTWGTCPWEIGSDGALVVHPGEGAPTGSETIVRPGEGGLTGGTCPWARYADVISSVSFAEEGGDRIVAPDDLGSLFVGLANVDSMDLSGADTSRVTNMSYMFDGCSSLTSLDLSGWDTSSVVFMYHMFNNCSSLATVTVDGAWSTASVLVLSSTSDMFSGCTSLVGGNGTAYDQGYTGVSRARIDMSGAPGYLTAGAPVLASGTWGECTWTIDSEGLLSVFPTDGASGQLADSRGYSSTGSQAYFPWYQHCSLIVEVSFADGVALPANCQGMFSGCSSLTSLDLSGADTSRAKNMSSMFYGCSSLASLDLSGWDTSGVTNMSSMFGLCSSLASLDLSSWETSSVRNMSYMFGTCSSLDSLDLSDWDTSRVTNMSSMFYGCSSLTTLDLSGWDTSRVTDMSSMFGACRSLATILVGDGWSTSSVTESEGMFDGCYSLVGGNGTTYDYGHRDAEYARIDSASRRGYLTYQRPQVVASGTWGTCPWEIAGDGTLTVHPGVGAEQRLDAFGDAPSPWRDYSEQVKRIEIISEGGSKVIAPGCSTSLFAAMDSLEAVDLSGLDVSGAESVAGMFACCGKLADVGGIAGWDTSSVVSMANMFMGCESLASLDLSGWDTSSVAQAFGMFSDCTALSSVGDLSSWDTSSLANATSMFAGCSSLASVGDLSGWVTSSLEGMGGMFAGCSSLASLDLSGWDTSPATDASGMLSGCAALTTAGDLSRWNTSRLTSTSNMFNGCSSLASLDLSGWDTSAVTDMSYMFDGCSSLTSAGDLSGWDTSSVTDMFGMFWGCSSLASLDLSCWDTSRVEMMSSMFHDCSSLTAITVGSGWSTSSVTESGDMFYGCYSLVGGNGTTYDYGHRDAEYARVDAAGTPGYLTGLTQGVVASGTWGTCPWEIAGDGTLTVHPGVGNDYEGWEMVGPWSEYADLITSAVFVSENGNAVVAPAESEYLFAGLGRLASVDLSGLDVSGVENMAYMFYECSELASLDLSGWDTAGVCNMNGMFNSCSSLTSAGDLSSWDTSSVVGMQYMFCNCSSLSYIGDVSGWNTSVVENMDNMFGACSKLTTDSIGDFSGWDISNVTSMFDLFAGCNSLTRLDLSGWNTSNLSSEFGGSFNVFGDSLDSLEEISVGSHFDLLKTGFPGDAGLDKWWSRADETWYTPYQIMTERSGIADTYLRKADVAPIDISAAEVAAIPDQTYTGSPLEPQVTVTLGGSALSPGTDYTVSYADNTEVGTATVTVTGAGGYTGTIERSFVIVKMSITNAQVTGVADVVWTGVAIEPVPIVTYDGIELSCDTDYTLDYGENIDAGVGTVIVTGIGLYDGSQEVPFFIVPPLDDGAGQQPIDWETVVIDENAPSGVSVSVPSGRGDDFSELSFIAKEMGNQDDVAEAEAAVRAVDEKMGSVILYDLHFEDGSGAEIPFEELRKTVMRVTLPVPEDWIASRVKVYYLGEGGAENMGAVANDDGTVSFLATHFSEYAVSQELVDISTGFSVGVEGPLTYSGAQLTPDVTLMGTVDGQQLVLHKDRDFTLSFGENVGPGAAAGTITISGTGNYTGTLTASFDIRDSERWRRLPGADRYDTAAKISREAFPVDGSSSWVVVATGANFPDALVASSLAGARECPVVLTDGGRLSSSAREELSRLGVTDCYIMGGTGTVSQAVENEIKSLGIRVNRVAGADRQSTSAEAFKTVMQLHSDTSTVVVASGTNYPDALSIGPWCYAQHIPMLLTGWDHMLTEEQLSLLVAHKDTIETVVILGDYNAVQESVHRQLKTLGFDVISLAGSDRYATSRAIAEFEMGRCGMSVAFASVATGTNFPDALAGASLCGRNNSVLMLVGPTESSLSVCADAVLTGRGDRVVRGYIFGGYPSVPLTTEERLERLTV